MARSVRQQRHDVARLLRAEGRSWGEVAAAIRDHWPELTARQAMRHAHQLTQGEALDRWENTFPTLRRPEERELGRWERWPGPGGIVPSWANLDRLATIYRCSAADLLADISDHRHLDVPETAPVSPDLSGVWHSAYVYPAGGEERHGEHEVLVRRHGVRLTAQSLSHPTGSRLRLDLTFTPPTATGTWTEWTSPTGRYRGASYHGSLQLLVDPSGRTMTGRWVGFGRSFKVNSGRWELTWVAAATDSHDRQIMVPAGQ